MRAGAASAEGARRHNENDVTMTIAGLWRYGDWRHVTTGCTALVNSKSPEGSIKRTHNTHTIYWLFLEFVVLKWSDRPRLRALM